MTLTCIGEVKEEVYFCDSRCEDVMRFEFVALVVENETKEANEGFLK